ncbi:hypothetical protein J6590_056842 [Homalodisca vitripennis]|nr:hypothetical protein J6590_056842 [Homalodisca vitripennis]
MNEKSNTTGYHSSSAFSISPSCADRHGTSFGLSCFVIHGEGETQVMTGCTQWVLITSWSHSEF